MEVVSLWRYPVKSMMGEELNAADVTERGLVGDRQFAVVDAATGKVAGAKNPRKWGNFFDFRAAYVEPPRVGLALPAVRLTLPDGTALTSEQPELEQILSGALGREVAFARAPGNGVTPPTTAEEYWPDLEGLEHRDTVTDWELPAGTFFDLAIVHVLTTSTPFRGSAFPAERRRRERRARLRRERVGGQDACDRQRGSPADHRPLSSLRHDDARPGRPAQGCRRAADGRAEQRRERRCLRRGRRGRRSPPRRPRDDRLKLDGAS